MATITSQTHPISVSWLFESGEGNVGLCFCPGKKIVRGRQIYDRNLEDDLNQLREKFRIHVIISLLPEAELSYLKLRQYGEKVIKHGFSFKSFPIIDMAAPTSIEATHELLKYISINVNEGKRIVIHCKGGIGRAGTIAACLLLLRKVAERHVDAIQMVREKRCKDAVQSRSQEEFVRKYQNYLEKIVTI